MAQIHPLVYVISGAIVTIISATIGENFKFFFYVGVGFLIFGVVSAFIGSFEWRGAQKTIEKHQQNAKTELMKKYPDFLPEQRQKQAQIEQQKRMIAAQQAQQRNNKYKFCKRCGTMAPLPANFCQRCGTKV